LLDRAENLFVRLSQGSRYQVEALEQLCRIYELEHEWQKAIEAGQKLEILSGRSLELEIAHYYCELAEQAVSEKDYAAARAFVKKAQSGRPRTLRGALTRAEIARDTNDTKTALRLYHRIIDESKYLITEALPQLVEIYEREDSTDQLERNLESMLAKHPEIKADVAYTAIVNEIDGVQVIDHCVEEYMLNEPTLTDFIDMQTIEDGNGQHRAIALKKVRTALSKLASTTPRYQCRECGFSSQQLLWQCPSCKGWETQRPFTSVRFDSVLQRSSPTT
jgi:lipopolysaccharide biosynthesis regulator YciM